MSEKLTTNSYIKELTALKKKYNATEGVLFSPDRLEITIKRTTNKHTVYYREFFDYLPDYACAFIIPMTIQGLVQTGIPQERIERVASNGISVELEGDIVEITSAILGELMTQKIWSQEELSKLFNLTQETINNLSAMSKLQFEWNDQTFRELMHASSKFLEVSQNPSFIADLKALNEKYSKTFEAIRDKMNKPKTDST